MSSRDDSGRLKEEWQPPKEFDQQVNEGNLSAANKNIAHNEARRLRRRDEQRATSMISFSSQNGGSYLEQIQKSSENIEVSAVLGASSSKDELLVQPFVFQGKENSNFPREEKNLEAVISAAKQRANQSSSSGQQNKVLDTGSVSRGSITDNTERASRPKLTSRAIRERLAASKYSSFRTRSTAGSSVSSSVSLLLSRQGEAGTASQSMQFAASPRRHFVLDSVSARLDEVTQWNNSERAVSSHTTEGKLRSADELLSKIESSTITPFQQTRKEHETQIDYLSPSHMIVSETVSKNNSPNTGRVETQVTDYDNKDSTDIQVREHEPSDTRPLLSRKEETDFPPAVLSDDPSSIFASDTKLEADFSFLNVSPGQNSMDSVTNNEMFIAPTTRDKYEMQNASMFASNDITTQSPIFEEQFHFQPEEVEGFGNQYLQQSTDSISFPVVPEEGSFLFDNYPQSLHLDSNNWQSVFEPAVSTENDQFQNVMDINVQSEARNELNGNSTEQWNLSGRNYDELNYLSTGHFENIQIPLTSNFTVSDSHRLDNGGSTFYPQNAFSSDVSAKSVESAQAVLRQDSKNIEVPLHDERDLFSSSRALACFSPHGYLLLSFPRRLSGFRVWNGEAYVEDHSSTVMKPGPLQVSLFAEMIEDTTERFYQCLHLLNETLVYNLQLDFND
eukprot:jgi/Galph1/4822/GphlegSOOS_G3454.1